MKIITDILDLVVAIFLMGMCLAIALTVVLPIFHEDREDLAFIDKTSPSFLGYELEEDFDGTYGYLDVLMITQVQDFNLPEPKRFTVATTNADMTLVDSTYTSSFNLNKVKGNIENLLLRAGTGNSRYELDYNYGLNAGAGVNILNNGNLEQLRNEDTFEWNQNSNYDDIALTQITGSKVISGNYSLAFTSPSSIFKNDENGDGIDDKWGIPLAQVTPINYETTISQLITDVRPNKSYRVTADMYCENCTAYMVIERQSHDGAVWEERSQVITPSTKESSKNATVSFSVSNNVLNFIIKFVKVNGEGNGQPETMVIDNIEFKVLEPADPFYEFVRVS